MTPDIQRAYPALVEAGRSLHWSLRYSNSTALTLGTLLLEGGTPCGLFVCSFHHPSCVESASMDIEKAARSIRTVTVLCCDVVERASVQMSEEHCETIILRRYPVPYRPVDAGQNTGLLGENDHPEILDSFDYDFTVQHPSTWP